MSGELTLPVLTRETRAAFHRGMETGIEGCILIVKNMPPGERTQRELVARMRDLIITNVPSARSEP